MLSHILQILRAVEVFMKISVLYVSRG